MNPLSSFRRQDFAGRTDIYALQQNIAVAQNQLQPAKPLQPTQVSGPVLTDTYVGDNTTRIARYGEFWRYYQGKHFSSDYIDGTLRVATNYCQLIADKRRDWAVGKGLSFVPQQGNEWICEALDNVWLANQKNVLLRKLAQFGMVTGDAFIYVSLRTKDLRGKDLPRDQWTIRLTALNPAYCYPVWSEDEPGVLAAAELNFPVYDSQAQRTVTFSARLSPTETVYSVNGEVKKTVPNPLGIIPLVHLPFNNTADFAFGSSLVEQIAPLNTRHNELTQTIDKIIKYHGEPTTIIYGTKLTNMERGAGRVWGNLPENATVENLEMKSDMAGFQLRLKQLEDQIFRLGRTPRISFDSEGLAISNTSGVAMALLFQPLVEASLNDQETMAKAIGQTNKVIVAIYKEVLGIDLLGLTDPEVRSKAMSIRCQFASLLPRDEKQELENAQTRITLGIWSKAEAIRQLSGVADSTRLAVELASDRAGELAMAAEKAKALLGQVPNLSAAFVDSPFLNEELVDMAKAVGDISHRSGTEGLETLSDSPTQESV